MIEMKVDLIPFGMDEGRKKIGTCKIINKGTSRSPLLGNYEFEIVHINYDGKETKIKGEIKKFERMKGIFELLKRVIEKSNITEEIFKERE